MQGRSEKRCRGIDRRGGREARLARGGIREHDAFLGLDGWGAGRSTRKEEEWGETIQTNWSRDGLRLKSDNLMKCYRLQDRGAVQGQSESRSGGTLGCLGQSRMYRRVLLMLKMKESRKVNRLHQRVLTMASS